MRRYSGLASRGLAISVVAVLTLSGCNNPSFVWPSVDATPPPIPAPPPVVPAGGFTISGVVFEIVDGVSVPVEGVKVEDTSDHASVFTAEDGTYVIRGVELVPVVGASRVSIYFAKNGYVSVVEDFVPASEETRLDVRLLRK